jgi:hypothetical protein
MKVSERLKAECVFAIGIDPHPVDDIDDVIGIVDRIVSLYFFDGSPNSYTMSKEQRAQFESKLLTVLNDWPELLSMELHEDVSSHFDDDMGYMWCIGTIVPEQISALLADEIGAEMGMQTREQFLKSYN